VKKRRAAVSELAELAIWMQDAEGRVLLHRESGSRRNGLWKLPLRSQQECAVAKLLFSDTYTITRYKVSLHIHEGAGHSPCDGDEWISRDGIASIPMAAPFRRAIQRLLAEF
jgi:hypothetical protein